MKIVDAVYSKPKKEKSQKQCMTSSKSSSVKVTYEKPKADVFKAGNRFSTPNTHDIGNPICDVKSPALNNFHNENDPTLESEEDIGNLPTKNKLVSYFTKTVLLIF